MSLHDAVIEIASDMESDAKSCSGPIGDAKDILLSYAKQLRRAVRASEGEKAVESPRYVKPNWEEEARAEFREKNKNISQKVATYERFEGQQMEILGGPLAGTDDVPTFWNVPSGGKVGMQLILDETFVYRLGDDSKLHYDEEGTLQLKTVKFKNQGGILLGE